MISQSGGVHIRAYILFALVAIARFNLDFQTCVRLVVYDKAHLYGIVHVPK